MPGVLTALLAPPCCCACGRASSPGELLCGRCRPDLARGAGRWLSIAGLDCAWAARPYERVARELVAAVKFRRLAPAIELAAELVGAEAPPSLLDGTLVPVPADPLRRAWRGFDPADLLAAALARRSGRPLSRLLRRRHGARQVGRTRRERLDSPPRVRATAPPPDRVVLVDDVVTTGATLSACASALRAAGAREVRAAAFAASGRALGTEPARA